MTVSGDKRRKLTDEAKNLLRAWDAEYMPRIHMARRLKDELGIDVSVQAIRNYLGPRDYESQQGERTIVRIYAPSCAVIKFREVAADLGFVTPAGLSSGQGSISQLIEAIGDGRVTVRPA